MALGNFLNNDIDNIIKTLSYGVEEILPIDSLYKKILENRILKIKLGADPSSPNLHLGHIIVLEKLNDFQKLGHEIIFLIGNFTACIGDPTGKSKTRPCLSPDDVVKNTKTYIEQISRVLDIKKVKIVYNADWYDVFKASDWIKLCAKVTLAQIMQREDFSNRLNNNIPIGLHELLYPLLQGYDSVILKADVEIGGTDQKFNMLMGRQLQESMNLSGQTIITMPIIEGLDGVLKMSKSLKNEISLTDCPQDAFMKIMSINDKLMITYYKHILRYSDFQISSLIDKEGYIETKKILAKNIISKYWNFIDAEKAYIYFTNIVQNKKYDKNILNKLILNKNEYSIIELMIHADNKLSRSAAKRLVQSLAVSINNIKIEDIYYIYRYIEGDVLKIGKQIVFALSL